ncbi:MAG: 3-dehydroquinate synthase [Planctomycetes bacterium]|nr:3-dehydroquinate synthase [Planctomycetota bacterium]
MDHRFRFQHASSTRVRIAAGAEAELPEAVRALAADDVVVCHDPAVAPLAARLARALAARAVLPVPGGEQAKRWDEVGRLASELLRHGASRGTALVAIGGGSVSDLIGLLASVWMRGVPLVLCPTTTLALCDAALGGKNGVDHDGCKNLLGCTRQPDLVLGDVDWLATLPDAPFREGFVEVVKKAAVLDRACFAELERLAPYLRARRPPAVTEAITMAVTMKMAVVQADEHERDRRRWLNAGHTIGHALESLAGGTLRHGQCVAMGLIAECRAAADVVPAEVRHRLEALLGSLDVASAVPPALRDPAALWALARQDKKARQGRVPMVVPRAIGDGVVVELSPERLAQAFG